ncbi:hypothetical protein [Patulibacter americanus]|uniref:hypothetical protein n=1 Tax=Patulibacter americanus TaxID=588672 RepID=UPI0003B39120|nr:hypothetical protein [Patulibacter americanus]
MLASISAAPFAVASAICVIVLALMLVRVIPGARRHTRAQRTVLAGAVLTLSGFPIRVVLDSVGVQAVCLALGWVVMATGFVLRRREQA